MMKCVPPTAEVDQCATKPLQFTPATTPIPRPNRSRCRSTRPSPTRSTAPITAPRCSISKPKAIATAGSPIRPPPCWKSASPTLEGGVGALAVATGQAALHYRLRQRRRQRRQHRLGAAALRHHAHAALAYPAAPGHHGPLRRQRQGRRDRAADRREHQGRVLPRPSAIPPAMSATSRRWPKVAHRHGVPLIVDNTVATPILLKPFEYGADIVGAFADQVHRRPRHHARRRDRRQRPLSVGRARRPLPGLQQPDASYHGLVYTEQFGTSAYIQRARSVYQRTMGAVLSPFNAFLLLQGIETVALRIERHVENARKVAEFLRNDPRVAWVNYAGLRRQPLLSRWCRNISTATPPRCSPSASRAASRPARNSTTR